MKASKVIKAVNTLKKYCNDNVCRTCMFYDSKECTCNLTSTPFPMDWEVPNDIIENEVRKELTK